MLKMIKHNHVSCAADGFIELGRRLSGIARPGTGIPGGPFILLNVKVPHVHRVQCLILTFNLAQDVSSSQILSPLNDKIVFIIANTLLGLVITFFAEIETEIENSLEQ